MDLSMEAAGSPKVGEPGTAVSWVSGGLQVGEGF